MLSNKQELYDSLVELKEENAAVYYERNLLVALLACTTKEVVGVAEDTDPDCPKGWRTVVFFEIKNQQLSFHMPDRDIWMVRNVPPYQGKWDSHSVEEKYRRMEKLI
jgi:hypothetical protein